MCSMTEPLTITIDFQGTPITYNESDLGNLDDEENVDDGLNIVRTDGGSGPGYTPTPREQIMSESLNVAPTSTIEIDSTSAVDVQPTPTACNAVPDPPPPTFILSPNFTLADLSSGTALSRTTVRAQAGLTVPDIVCNLQAWAENIGEELALSYGRMNMLITSGFRYGSGSSQHERGQACDIQFPLMTTTQVFQIALFIRDNVAYDQLILEYGGNKPWIHCSFNRAGNRLASASNKFGTRLAAGSYAWGSLRNMA